jgi:hypothetical protein
MKVVVSSDERFWGQVKCAAGVPGIDLGQIQLIREILGLKAE